MTGTGSVAELASAGLSESAEQREREAAKVSTRLSAQMTERSTCCFPHYKFKRRKSLGRSEWEGFLLFRLNLRFPQDVQLEVPRANWKCSDEKAHLEGSHVGTVRAVDVAEVERRKRHVGAQAGLGALGRQSGVGTVARGGVGERGQ